MKYGCFRGKASKTAGNRAFGPTLPCRSHSLKFNYMGPLLYLFSLKNPFSREWGLLWVCLELVLVQMVNFGSEEIHSRDFYSKRMPALVVGVVPNLILEEILHVIVQLICIININQEQEV